MFDYLFRALTQNNPFFGLAALSDVPLVTWALLFIIWFLILASVLGFIMFLIETFEKCVDSVYKIQHKKRDDDPKYNKID